MAKSFEMPKGALLDTAGASPQVSKPFAGFEVPSAALDTTIAMPQTGKREVPGKA
ncbi:MAG: hypothetical protein AB7O49_02185 [Sphingomonadales bacterium]